MAYRGFKVQGSEVDRNGLAFINNKLSAFGAMPSNVIKGWTQENNVDQNALLGAGADASRLPYRLSAVSPRVARAVSEFVAFKTTRTRFQRFIDFFRG